MRLVDEQIINSPNNFDLLFRRYYLVDDGSYFTFCRIFTTLDPLNPFSGKASEEILKTRIKSARREARRAVVEYERQAGA